MPDWELQSWRYLFDMYGPLDWKREDLLFARVTQFQAMSDKPLKDFILLQDPNDRVVSKEDSLLSKLGYEGD